MGKKSKLTLITFIVFCISLISTVITIIFDYGILISAILMVISGCTSLLSAFYDKKKLRPKMITILFPVFVFCLGLVVYGSIEEIYRFNPFGIGYYLFQIGLYGIVPSGFFLIVFWLRQPKKVGSVYPPLDSTSLKKLNRILSANDKILLIEVAQSLQTSRLNLLKFIEKRRDELPSLKLEGEYIYNLSEIEEWVCFTCGFLNKKRKNECSECSSPFNFSKEDLEK